MGKGGTKKHAKGRLDKFYQLAKDQGYRARSAFKLIQLNKKFAILDGKKCVIDLCAAPGGWLQVAQKYMQTPNLIIGVDLEKIKPIPGVITHVADITTEHCRTILRRDMKTWKADVVLHDGAPNVGTSWAQDAFTQSELTLSACKLATEFLLPGGTFVTKVFRSKDYFKLMWVFNQLFGRVEATKPTASRAVSAEIFVVCRDFLAPKKIDPRILDPHFAFKEQDEKLVETDPKKIKAQQGAILNDLLHPEKQKRHRSGYEDGDYTLNTVHTAEEFITSIDFMSILSKSNSILVGDDEFSEKLKASKKTSNEILECLKDLKVLGKKDFKDLMRWRDSIRLEFGLVKKEEPKDEEVKEEEELDVETIIAQQQDAELHKEKKKRKKQREKVIKSQKRMDLGMKEPMEIGLEQLGGEDADINNGEALSSEEGDTREDDESSEVYLSDDEERARKIIRLDEEMDKMYEQYEELQMRKNPAKNIKKIKESVQGAAFEEWYGIGSTSVPETAPRDREFDSSSDDEIESEMHDNAGLSQDAKLFFSNPLFKEFNTTNNEAEIKKDEDGFPKSAFEEEHDKLEAKRKGASKVKAVDDSQFEIVPATEVVPEDSDSDDEFEINNAATYTIASKMAKKSTKRDLINDSFNRYAFNDPEGLPEWFIKDESHHNKPSLPVTKEAVEIMKERQKALNARPIKKVAEAKWRKQNRLERRIQKAIKKSEGLAEQEEMSEKTKIEMAAKLLGKARASKKAKKEVKLVVAKGNFKGVKGRPKGIKGKYKMVDGPMKKESRALKRVEKKRRKGSKKK